jgi:hypothetical protein
MSFGRRERYDRRNEPRININKCASVIFGPQHTKVGGAIRNISLSGLRFVTQTPQYFPRQVVLEFRNGESFECEVVRATDGQEFGLRFIDPSAFARSTTKEDIDAVYQFAKSRTPSDIYEILESVEFFGDEELEQIVWEYTATHQRFVQLFSERILPRQDNVSLIT